MELSSILAIAGAVVPVFLALLRLGHLAGVQSTQIAQLSRDVAALRKTVDAIIWERHSGAGVAR